MGRGSEYQFGPVTNYSIRTTMKGDNGQGWTWGIYGQTPVAALSNAGQLQIAGNFGLGVNAYSLSKIHAKSPAVTEWGVMVEVLANRRIIGLGHDGTNGFISVGVMDGQSGFSPLEFRTNNVSRMIIDVDGKVGIGTNTPSDQLEIVSSNKKIGFNTAIPGITSGGVVSMSRSDGAKVLYLGTSNATNDDPVIFGMGGSSEMRFVSAGGSSQGFGFYTNTTLPVAFGARISMPAAAMKIMGDGKVGIGTLSPDQKLTVKGKIHAEEVIIDLSVPAPDYVFENDYSLTPLDTLKAYLAQHKHLPEVPSAKEMEKDGVKVGEMEMILLKKIEELTLHLIQTIN
jgi:hypothetical protein